MKFIADRMLGKLAKSLRMLGYDTIYYRGDDLHQLLHMARHDGRVILTRNTKLILRGPEDRIFGVTEDNPHDQLRQLIEKGHVPLDEEKFFCRCLLCNTLLDQIPREKAEGNVPDFVFHQQKEFFQCPQCKRIYWPGTHQKNMERRLKELQIQ
jgi:uncharacterized protein